MVIENNEQEFLPSLSRKEALILALLIDSGSNLFGLEMVEFSNGELKRGTIYVTLQRMQEKGLIDSKPEQRLAPEIGIPRRLYWPTARGHRSFAVYQTIHPTIKSDSVVRHPDGEPEIARWSDGVFDH
jgi:DNA-binding PadR family transcriptional regulator